MWLYSRVSKCSCGYIPEYPRVHVVIFQGIRFNIATFVLMYRKTARYNVPITCSCGYFPGLQLLQPVHRELPPRPSWRHARDRASPLPHAPAGGHAATTWRPSVPTGHAAPISETYTEAKIRMCCFFYVCPADTVLCILCLWCVTCMFF